MSDISQNLQAILREHDDDGIGDAARLYERIERAFNLFSCGEGYGASRMSEYLAGAKEELTKDRERDFGGIQRDMDDWLGEAANQFADYMNDLYDGTEIMLDRINTLQMILQAHALLVKGMREDVCDLIQKTLDGIAAAETDGWKVAVTVAGVVAGFAAGVAGSTVGLPVWAVIGTVAGAMADGAASIAVEAAGAEDELGVIVQFVDSAESMLHVIDIERLRIEKGFRALADSITDAKLIEVRPNRPDIVTAPDFRPESFGMAPGAQAGHPVPTDTRDLVPEPQKRADGPFDRATTPDGQSHDRYPEQGPA
ncbi:hypothetical protein [Actinophytocola sp.]|uniref:hypothetical protein n=1 Tax=Actinophytocola sp. TaxID=1872138 RepID=UPI002ED06481